MEMKKSHMNNMYRTFYGNPNIVPSTGLFKMIVGVLTISHTHYT